MPIKSHVDQPISVRCHCGHKAKVNAGQYRHLKYVEEIGKRLTCSKCGWRGFKVRRSGMAPPISWRRQDLRPHGCIWRLMVGRYSIAMVGEREFGFSKGTWEWHCHWQQRDPRDIMSGQSASRDAAMSSVKAVFHRDKDRGHNPVSNLPPGYYRRR